MQKFALFILEIAKALLHIRLKQFVLLPLIIAGHKTMNGRIN